MFPPKRWQFCGCDVNYDVKCGPWCLTCGGVIESWYRNASQAQIAAALQTHLEAGNQERLKEFDRLREEYIRKEEEEERERKRLAKRDRMIVIGVIVGLALLVAPFAAMGAEGVWSFVTRLVIGMVGVVVCGVVLAIWYIWLMSLGKEPPPRTREEALGRQIDAMAGYIATDDKAWHKFWSLWD